MVKNTRENIAILLNEMSRYYNKISNDYAIINDKALSELYETEADTLKQCALFLTDNEEFNNIYNIFCK